MILKKVDVAHYVAHNVAHNAAHPLRMLSFRRILHLIGKNH